MKILAVDPGAKRIGLAASDELQITIRLLPVLRVSPGQTVPALVQLIRDESFQKVLVGLPLNMDGSEGNAAKQAKDLASRLKNALDGAGLSVPVLLWDERLTTFEAEQRLRERGIAKLKAKDYLDSAAAEILLEDYLRHETA